MSELIRLIVNPMVLALIGQGLRETLYMMVVSLVVAGCVGLPLGVILVVTEPGHLRPQRGVNQALAIVINIGRSIPFIILMVAIIPFTRMLVGTSIGTAAAIVPLTIAAIPFVARIVQSALKEVDPGVIEAALAMGASPRQIVTKVLLREALPSLILGGTITAINLISYSAMAGAVGGGGLGDLAIRYGYQRFQVHIMLLTVLILVGLVQGLQFAGEKIAARLDHRGKVT